MSRWNAVSDFDYADEIGSPVPRMMHSEKPRPMINPCICGHEKGDHQVRIGQRGNYTPCCIAGCKCDGFRRRPQVFVTFERAQAVLQAPRYCPLCDLWMAARTCKACGAATEPAAK